MATLIAGMVGCTEVTPPAQYDLTMSVAPGGSGTAIDLTNASPYTAGTGVGIRAVANPGYHFVNWTASAGGFADTNAAETTFTMPTQNATITANFALFAGGTGIEDNPYQIVDWYQLYNVRNDLDSYFMLMSNLDSTTAGYEEQASPTANQGKGWQPIGSYGSPFAGTFDGEGYEIRDLFINRPDEACVGLFGAVGDQGVIKNIGVVSTTVAGRYDVGTLVGRNNGTVSDSYAAGMVTSVSNNESVVGGLVGDNYGAVSDSYYTGNVTGGGWVGGLVGQSGGTIINCYSSADVVGSYWDVGGLVGFSYGTVCNSYSAGNVTGEGSVGGLVGQTTGTISNSYSSAEVVGSYWDVGGLVGVNSVEGTVSNSYSTGSVTGDDYVGGLVGNNAGPVSNSYSTGSVTGDHYVGGLVGSNGGIDNNGHICRGAVSNSYSTGSVTGGYAVGGLIGLMGYGTISNSLWDMETSGIATSDGGTRKTTTEMKDIATFSVAGWNITAVANPGTRDPSYTWNIIDGQTYPFLSWQSVS
jgi:hypothetical protein